jgi:hypothetical protein
MKQKIYMNYNETHQSPPNSHDISLKLYILKNNLKPNNNVYMGISQQSLSPH